ncbi:hypothetical protein G7054_g330 [Neopestalotiopsis clavispora]|nr:hypothetical protein G7054_g330 [Neopestalotiopsis clavispora]
MISDDQQRNYDLFRDCLSTVLIDKAAKPEPKIRRRAKAKRPRGEQTNIATATTQQDEQNKLQDAEELGDFAEYIAAETFESLPKELKTIEHHDYAQDLDLQARYALPLTGEDVSALIPALDPSVSESLLTYGIADESRGQGAPEFLAPVLTAFISAIAAPPPAPSSTRTTACELCGRDWIPLTYHHLIPRFVHAKAVKRGWHREEDLQSVAWLCRACHSFVHKFASHEDLARHYYTVDLLLEEDQIVQFAKWISRLRWKGR